MADPFVSAIKGGIGGLSEVISLADDLDQVAQQVSDLGKKEIAARAAIRRKQNFVTGDYGFVNAVEEFNRVKEAQTLREQIKKETIRQWGPKAWEEVEKIEKRQKEEHSKMFTEDGHDREKLFRVKLACFGAAFIIVMILWFMGIIRQLSEAFYA